MSDRTVTITFTVEQVPVLNDVLYEALHSADADLEEMAAYQALCDDVKRQLQEQRR
jgi:hypothetical protein